MANHRKLFFDPNVINITAFCEPYCDPTGDNNRICPPLICKKTCPYTCTNPFPSLIPPLKLPPPPPPPTTTNHHHKTILQNNHLYLIISLSVLAALCFIFSTYSIYKYYANRNRELPSPEDDTDHTHDDHAQFLDEEHGPVLDHPIWYIRTVGLNPSAINAITICRYKKGDGLVEGTDCSVCLSEFQEDETLRLLPKCNHAFHLPCIDTWLRSHTNCPMCRAGIVSDGPAQQARPARPDPARDENIVMEESQVVVVDEEIEERGFVVGGEGDETSSSDEDVVGKFQQVRRTMSFDCVSASMRINYDTQLMKVKDLVGSSMGRSLHREEPILMMKRSVSCSGDVLMKKSTARGQN